MVIKMTDYIAEHCYELIWHGEHLQIAIHRDNEKWWTNFEGAPILPNKGELIALIHSELSEALEGVRKNKMDDHLKDLPSDLVEMADAVIRIFDYVEGIHHRALMPVIIRKLLYNRERADHKIEVRATDHGKKF